ncbi:Hypothetical predicted protein [Paramuricea clavata]|uniref:Uncharacterized protein n=1 Tax=Paramuricea clavata TaxID=317549 RepID=A0A6S7IEK2_PARCT|nr:Hypothetical predicted protein [Paramuricea clavata]
MAVLFRIFASIFIITKIAQGECSISQAFLRINKEKYLANQVIEIKQAKTELECLMHCLGERSCASVNYKTSGINKGLCELNSKTLQEASDADGSIHNPEFNHIYIDKKEPSPPVSLPPISCKDILTKSAGATSGLYDVSVDNKIVTVYCEMILHGGGFTFIPKSAVKNGTLSNFVSQLFTNHSEVLLYILKKDGSQTYTHIQQLKEKSQTPLVVLQNTNSGSGIHYDSPTNSFMLDYLYLSTSIYTNGFLSNNMEVKYNFSTFPIRSYFAFFPNHREQTPNTYHDSNYYENQGVAVDWRKTGMVSTERIPSNFFYLTEVHYGGSGCYTSSDRWVEANGTAIGLR